MRCDTSRHRTGADARLFPRSQSDYLQKVRHANKPTTVQVSSASESPDSGFVDDDKEDDQEEEEEVSEFQSLITSVEWGAGTSLEARRSRRLPHSPLETNVSGRSIVWKCLREGFGKARSRPEAPATARTQPMHSQRNL